MRVIAALRRYFKLRGKTDLLTEQFASQVANASAPETSVVIPFCSEEESINPMHRALKETLEPTHYSCELIFVDDGNDTVVG